jgi:hypothetical protein
MPVFGKTQPVSKYFYNFTDEMGLTSLLLHFILYV